MAVKLKITGALKSNLHFCMLSVLFLVSPGAFWAAVLLGGWLFVMALELINSALEEAFDLISPEFNIHVKYGKDMASAAIFVAVCANALLWLIMLWDVVL